MSESLEDDPVDSQGGISGAKTIRDIDDMANKLNVSESRVTRSRWDLQERIQLMTRSSRTPAQSYESLSDRCH